MLGYPLESGIPMVSAHTAKNMTDLLNERPWLSQYPEAVPHEVEIPDISLVDQLAEVVQQYPDQQALAFYGRHMTYTELDIASTRFANRLIELGHQPDEPVMMALPNLPQFLVAAFGILKAGGIVAAFNPLLTEREIEPLARDARARTIIVLDRFWSKVEPLLDNGVFQNAIVTGVQDELPRMKRLLYPFKYRKSIVIVPHDPERGRYQYRKLLKGAPATPVEVAVQPDDVAMFQYTGGTTGQPKAAVLTHRNLVANTTQSISWISYLGMADERVMCILPFFHAYGSTLGLCLATKIAATMIIVPRFEIQDALEQIEQERPTVLPGVPMLFNALNNAVRSDPRRRDSLRSIQYCISGGSPLPAEVQHRFEELTGGRLVEGYGLSEASPVTHCNPLDGSARLGTIGMPLPNTEARIVDTETGESVPAGERGLLLVRGPQVMRGYWRRPKETAAVLSDDGWLSTGDVAIMQPDGYFQIVDRLKDVIITGGENIYPREIEDVLYQHPKILEVAVIGVEHQAGGQVARAYIVLRGASSLSPGDLRQWCAERMAKYKIPRQFEFRSELPKTAAGKVLRRALKEEAATEKQ